MEEGKHVLNYYVEFEVPLMLGGPKLASLWHVVVARFKSERPVLPLKEEGVGRLPWTPSFSLPSLTSLVLDLARLSLFLFLPSYSSFIRLASSCVWELQGTV